MQTYFFSCSFNTLKYFCKQELHLFWASPEKTFYSSSWTNIARVYYKFLTCYYSCTVKDVSSRGNPNRFFSPENQSDLLRLLRGAEHPLDEMEAQFPLPPEDYNA